MSATLPGVRVLRRTNCAHRRHDDVRMRRDETVEALVEQSLRRIEKFLHVLPSCLRKSRPAAPPNSATRRGRIATHARSVAVPDDPREPTRRIANQFVESSFFFSSPKSETSSFRCADSGFRGSPAPVGMSALEGVEKSSFLRGRKMANLENDFEMRRGNRHGIGGVGDLRDEAAVLAQRGGEPLPRARGPTVEYVAQESLVRLEVALRVASRSVVHRGATDRHARLLL